MSENFFFACIPRYLRVQHSFAKGIKQNTKYRIMIFKGIQKCDEMKQPIKSKIVGGKIDLESPQLFFNIAFYNPTKNIQFTIKLFQQKPNEDETQIGSIVIISSDYIKSFQTENKVWYQVEGMLKDDLFCTFDLIVEKSKVALINAVKKFNPHVQKGGKQVDDDIKSQSSASMQIIRQGEGFISPKKKIQRKSGRQLKLRSTNNNRSEDEQSDAGSVTSQNKPLRKILPSEKQEKLFQSSHRFTPTKASYIEGLQVTKSSILPSSFPVKLAETDPLQESFPTQSFAGNDSYLPTYSNPMIESEQKIMKESAITSIINPTEFQYKSTQKEFDILEKKRECYEQKTIQLKQQTDLKAENKEQKVKNEEEKSEKREKSIYLREKQVKRVKSEKIETQKILLSSKLSSSKIEKTEVKPSEVKLQNELKIKMIYSVFFIVSAYLIYIAMTPTRRT